MFKKIGKAFLSLFMMLTIMTVSYAADVDNIFGITAHAASYTEKATSMIEFYKNGSALDRKKVSKDELYVFGVFVSNFLMPFQSQVGTMSSDAFVTQMAQTFFGDAYTAQQLSDMKYTLGMVQTAQSNSRRKIIDCDTRTPISVNSMYMNFTGFFSPTQLDNGSSSALHYYTYEGSSSKISAVSTTADTCDFTDVVWASGISVCDVILGQLISVCPSQAAVYMGTASNLTSILFIDCFGNISDSNNTVIVPACMNPFSFYNSYLDENRKPTVGLRDEITCPIQLPINNAFWMGTMATPQSLASRVSFKASKHNSAADDDDTVLEEVYFVTQSAYTSDSYYLARPGILPYDSTSLDSDSGLIYPVENIQNLAEGTATGQFVLLLDNELLTKWKTSAPDNWYVSSFFSNVLGLSDTSSSLGLFPCLDTSLTYETDASLTFDLNGVHTSPVICDDGITLGIVLYPSQIKDSSKPGAYWGAEDCYGLNKIFYELMWDSDGNYKHTMFYMSSKAEEHTVTVDGKDVDIGDTSFTFTLSELPAAALGKAVYGNDDDIHCTLEYTGGALESGYIYSLQGDDLVAASSDDEEADTYSVMDCYISLSNLYIPLSRWTNSSTVLTGIRSADGDEIGIYFSPEISTYFINAWKTASGNSGKSYADLTSEEYLVKGKDGYFDPWNFTGGTAIPYGLVLDDIALFDTYNSFSESLADSISVISMYKNKTAATWWADDSSHGVAVKSVYRQIVDATQACIDAKNGDGWFTFAGDIAKRFAEGNFDDYSSTGVESAYTALMNIDIDSDMDIKNTAASNVSAIANLNTLPNGGSGDHDISYNDIISNCKSLAILDSVNQGEFAKRAILATVLNDPAWLIADNYLFKSVVVLQIILEGDSVDGIPCSMPTFSDKIESLNDTSSFDLGKVRSTPLPNVAADDVTKINNFGDLFTKAFATTTYLNHCFLQKAHPAMPTKTQHANWGGVIIQFVGFAMLAVATAIMLAAIAAGTVITGGTLVLAIGGVVLCAAGLVAGTYTLVSLSDQRSALNEYYSKGNFVGKNAIIAEDMQALISGSAGSDKAMVNRLTDAYSDKDENLGGDIYVSDYTLYGPYGSLGSALSGVAKVYTTQGIVDADKISSKVGSYITNDVNLWGGIYYAYMFDIFGLTIEDNVMSSAQLKTNFPVVPDNITSESNMDLASLLNGGDDIDSEQAEAEQRRDLMQRFDLMTGLSTAADYVSQWLNNTLNGFLIDTHNGITGGSGSGNIANIGGGSIYTGYSSYLATASLSEMPFTSWVMEYYNIIYTVLMVIILVLAIFMCVTGHRTIRKSIFSVLLMAFILLLPRLCIDSLVTISNTVAQATYKDRFSFWAYAQHQQYMTKIQNAESKNDKIEFLIVTNMQQAEDYYSEDKGVTLKWMSPKKSSYWDALNGITGGSEDSLNMSIFKWLFQGQFSQTSYSTDPLATYVYRPYNDIAMSARSLVLQNIVVSGNNFLSVGKKDSNIVREAYAYDYAQGMQAYVDKLAIDWDIKPAHSSYDPARGAVTANKIPGADYTLSLTKDALSKILYGYTYAYFNETVTSTSLDSESFVDASDTTGYLAAYPCIKNSSATGTTAAGMQKLADSGSKGIDSSVELYYQYSESPYYYFYQMFKSAKSRYGDNSMKKLLMSDRFFKYSDAKNAAAVGKGEVPDGTLMDFLDLESLFTFVIPYLQESNYYVDEWTDLWGMSVEAGDPEGFSDNLKGIWKMYAPWVDAMYDTSYARGTIKIAGKRISLDDAINPGAYTEYRPMVFGLADAERNYVATSDMTDVEKRIIEVLENTYIDLMYLNNYSDFDDEVLLSAAAMIATFNFNEAFSENAILGDNITMYPTGYEVKNFSYDSFMRMSLMNTTGASVFSDEDIYTTVLENTSFVTGLLLIVNDAVACYALPVLKMVVLIGLFFLGLLICIGGFLSPPEKIIKFVGKQFLIPVGMFFGILVANILISALFVGEGLTNYVGQRAVTVTTGDPTMTILLMLAINCLVCFGLYMTLKTLLRSFKVSLNWVVGATVGFAGAILHKAKATLHGVAGTGARVAGGVVRGVGKMARTNAVTSAIKGANNRRRQSRDSDSEPVKRYKGGSGSSSETDKHNSNVTAEKTRTARSPEGLGHSSGNEANKTPTALNEKSRILDKSDVKSSTETYVGEDGKTHKRKKYHTYARGTTSAERKEAKGYSKQQYAKSMAEINHASQDVTGLSGFKKKRELQKKYMTEAQFANGGKKLSRADKKKYAQKASSEIKAQRTAFATQRSEAKAAYHKSKQTIRDSKKGRMVDVTEEKTAELRAKMKANQEKSAASLAEREKKHQEIQEKRRESVQKHEAARKAAEEKRAADQRKREEDFIHEMNYREAQEKKAKFDRKDNQRKASQVKKADNVAKYLQKNQGGKQAQAARDAGFDLGDKNLSKNSEFRDYVSKQTSKKNTQRSVVKKRGKK